MTKEVLTDKLNDVLIGKADFLCIQGPFDKCIQFTAAFQLGGKLKRARRVIVMDLPCPMLNVAEFQRAANLFSKHGTLGPTEMEAEDQGGKPFWLVTWNLYFGVDVEKAAQKAIDFMREIYELPEGFVFDVNTGKAAD